MKRIREKEKKQKTNNTKKNEEEVKQKEEKTYLKKFGKQRKCHGSSIPLIFRPNLMLIGCSYKEHTNNNGLDTKFH